MPVLDFSGGPKADGCFPARVHRGGHPKERKVEMDFALPYTKEQEEFRQEVRSWLDENVPEEMKEPYDSRDFSREQYIFWRETHQKLAAKGWLFPTFPKEYGGGGLTGDHETIISEEYQNYRVPNNFTNQFVFPALLVWGTEEQKQKFLVLSLIHISEPTRPY